MEITRPLRFLSFWICHKHYTLWNRIILSSYFQSASNFTWYLKSVCVILILWYLTLKFTFFLSVCRRWWEIISVIYHQEIEWYMSVCRGHFFIIWLKRTNRYRYIKVDDATILTNIKLITTYKQPCGNNIQIFKTYSIHLDVK